LSIWYKERINILWGGKPFIIKVTQPQVTDGVSDNETIRGWVSNIQFSVQMTFAIPDVEGVINVNS